MNQTRLRFLWRESGFVRQFRTGVSLHSHTMHSLESLRPWKAEQLGGGYALSSWCEQVAATSAAAVIAVSDGMRADLMAAYPSIRSERAVVIRPLPCSALPRCRQSKAYASVTPMTIFASASPDFCPAGLWSVFHHSPPLELSQPRRAMKSKAACASSRKRGLCSAR